MAKSIDSISYIGRVSGVDSVRGYTQEESKTKSENIEKAIKEHAELSQYLSKYPNSEHLTFGELLEKYVTGSQSKKETSEEDGYILSVNNK